MLSSCIVYINNCIALLGCQIVGHSLGGGTAALLTFVLRERKEWSTACCVAFAPGLLSCILVSRFTLLHTRRICSSINLWTCILKSKIPSRVFWLVCLGALISAFSFLIKVRFWLTIWYSCLYDLGIGWLVQWIHYICHKWCWFGPYVFSCFHGRLAYRGWNLVPC